MCRWCVSRRPVPHGWRASSRRGGGSPGGGSPGGGSSLRPDGWRWFAGAFPFARRRGFFEFRPSRGGGRSRRHTTALRASGFSAERAEASRSRGGGVREWSLSGDGRAPFGVARLDARRGGLARDFGSFVVGGSASSISSRADRSLLGDLHARGSVEHEDTRRAG